MVIAERMAGSIVFLSYLLSVAGFVFDFFSPEGYTEWVFYLLPLLLISYTDSTKHLFSITVVNSMLLLCGYIFSENIFDHIVIIHRVSGTVMIWALSINIYTRIRAQEWLRKNEKRLKESRQDLDRAQAVTKIGSWRIDSVNNKVAWSEELYHILNVTGKVPLSYELFLSKVHPDDRDYVDKEWKAALKSGVFDVKYRVLVDHTITWVQAKAELESNEQGIFTGGFGTVQDITEQRKSFQDLKMNEKRLKILNENLENIVIQRTKQVRVLSKALTLAEQRERKRFSYILHENLQQQLLGAGLLLQQHLADHRKTGEDKTPDDVADGLELINKALQTTKMLSIELNPPILSSEGLDQALEWLIRHMKENYGLQVAFHSEGDIKKVKNETQLMLTQMVRELLTNVIGHSGVHSARLEAICKDKTMQITVSDQGRGFNPEEVFTEETGKNHLGLISIRERLHLFGGELIIESQINKGTHMVINIPVEGCR